MHYVKNWDQVHVCFEYCVVSCNSGFHMLWHPIYYCTYLTVTQVGVSLFCAVFYISKQNADISPNFMSDLNFVPWNNVSCENGSIEAIPTQGGRIQILRTPWARPTALTLRTSDKSVDLISVNIIKTQIFYIHLDSSFTKPSGTGMLTVVSFIPTIIERSIDSRCSLWLPAMLLGIE
jgi:hypothetical protein